MRDTLKGGFVTCANNALYAIKGIGEIPIVVAHGGTIMLRDVLYVLGIKKNLISLKNTHFDTYVQHNNCKVHDCSDGDVLVVTSTLYNGL